MIVVDSSAVIAILLEEPDHASIIRILARQTNAVMAAPNVLEVLMVLTGRDIEKAAEALDCLLSDHRITVTAWSDDLVPGAHAAFIRYGKGRHPAGLNFGDCMAYALAKRLDAPLLFKGNDFSQTDVRVAG